MARGVSSASTDTRILPPRLRLASRLGLGGFPRIAPVVIHAHVAARARRAAIADLVPRGRMRIIESNDVMQNAVLEKTLRRQIAPRVIIPDMPVLHRLENVILLERAEIVKAAIVRSLGLGVERGKRAAPGLLHRRQFGMAITVAAVGVQFVVEHGG